MHEIDRTDTAFPLTLNVSRDGVGGVTGLAPTVALRRTSDGAYLDWNDATFKTSGWTTKYGVLTELEAGNYERLVDVNALALAAGTKLSAEYAIDDGGSIKGSGSDAIIITDTRADVTLLRKVARNRMEETAGNPGSLVLYDDDGTTALVTWPLRDASGGAVVSATGAPARRGAGT